MPGGAIPYTYLVIWLFWHSVKVTICKGTSFGAEKKTNYFGLLGCLRFRVQLRPFQLELQQPSYNRPRWRCRMQTRLEVRLVAAIVSEVEIIQQQHYIPASQSSSCKVILLCTQLTHCCQNVTRSRDGVKVLWCLSHLVWLLESFMPICL